MSVTNPGENAEQAAGVNCLFYLSIVGTSEGKGAPRQYAEIEEKGCWLLLSQSAYPFVQKSITDKHLALPVSATVSPPKNLPALPGVFLRRAGARPDLRKTCNEFTDKGPQDTFLTLQ